MLGSTVLSLLPLRKKRLCVEAGALDLEDDEPRELVWRDEGLVVTELKVLPGELLVEAVETEEL
jgi:hypothetical protein